MLATSSTAYTGSRSLPRSTRERGCALSLSICSRTLPFPSGARVSMKTDPETASDALKRFVASAAAWCEYPASCAPRSEEHTSELQSRLHLVCRLLLEKKKHLPDSKSVADRLCGAA